MQRLFQCILCASVLTVPAWAEDAPVIKTDRPDHVPYQQRLHRLNDSAKASDLMGMPVRNLQDEKLGKISDLAVDVESGRIVQVILSLGGIAGLGKTHVAVPPGALRHAAAQKVLYLDADQARLKSAPTFDTSKWAEYSDQEHLSAVYRHYGEEPAFDFVHRGDAALQGGRSADSVPNTVSTRKADGTWEKDRLTADSQSMIPASRLGQVQRASKVIGLAAFQHSGIRSLEFT